MLKKYRSELMGISILWIIVFHMKAAVPGYLIFFSAFKSVGFLGVDIFFLLSGFGLSFAWAGSSGVGAFLKRRLLRVLPAYWMALTCVAVYYCLAPEPTWKQWFFSVVGMDFFVLGVTDTWFVPSIVLLYFCFPVLMWLREALSCFWMCFVCVLVWAVFYAICLIWTPWLLIFVARIPAFLIGVFLAFKYKNDGLEMSVSFWVFVSLVALFFGVKISTDQVFQWQTGILWLICSFLAYPACHWIGKILVWIPEPLRMALRWVGGLSFELYLVHVFLFVLAERALVNVGYGIYATLIISSFLGAWALSWLASRARSAVFRE